MDSQQYGEYRAAIDGTVAEILKLCLNVRIFLLKGHEYQPSPQALKAMFALRHLREVWLCNVIDLPEIGGDLALPMLSVGVERIVLHQTKNIDIASMLNRQTNLKHFHLDMTSDDITSPLLDVGSIWAALEELVIITHSDSVCLEFINTAIVCASLLCLSSPSDAHQLCQRQGSLRNLRTLSVQSPGSKQALSTLLHSLQRHRIALKKFRVFVDTASYELFEGFGVSTIAEIAESLPSLDTLCLDQSIDLWGSVVSPWPGRWVSMLPPVAYGTSHRLTVFAPIERLLHSLWEGQPVDNHHPALRESSSVYEGSL